MQTDTVFVELNLYYSDCKVRFQHATSWTKTECAVPWTPEPPSPFKLGYVLHLNNEYKDFKSRALQIQKWRPTYILSEWRWQVKAKTDLSKVKIKKVQVTYVKLIGSKNTSATVHPRNLAAAPTTKTVLIFPRPPRIGQLNNSFFLSATRNFGPATPTFA